MPRSAADLKHVASTLSMPEAAPLSLPETSAATTSPLGAESLFGGSSLLNGLNLDLATLQKLFASPVASSGTRR